MQVRVGEILTGEDARLHRSSLQILEDGCLLGARVANSPSGGGGTSGDLLVSTGLCQVARFNPRRNPCLAPGVRGASRLNRDSAGHARATSQSAEVPPPRSGNRVIEAGSHLANARPSHFGPDCHVHPRIFHIEGGLQAVSAPGYRAGRTGRRVHATGSGRILRNDGDKIA